MNVNSPMHDLDARKRLSNVCWSHTSRLVSEDTLDTISRCSYYYGQSESLLTGSDDYGHIVMRHGRWLCALGDYALRDVQKRIFLMVLNTSVMSLTYLCQDVNRQICEYHTVLSPEFWTGDDEQPPLANLWLYKKLSCDTHNHFKQRNLPSEQTIKQQL